jgi:SAM-dependent methyltransferase
MCLHKCDAGWSNWSKRQGELSSETDPPRCISTGLPLASSGGSLSPRLHVAPRRSGRWPLPGAPPLDGQHALDLACGFGLYTRLLKQHGAAQVLGVDISSEMIRLAQQQEQAAPLGRATEKRIGTISTPIVRSSGWSARSNLGSLPMAEGTPRGMKTGVSFGVPDRGGMRAEQTTGERQSYTAGGKRYVPARACAEQVC